MLRDDSWLHFLSSSWHLPLEGHWKSSKLTSDFCVWVNVFLWSWHGSWDRIPKTLVISLWWGWERSLETNWESRIDMHSLSCVKWVARRMLLCSTGSPTWCSEMTRRGGMWRWEEGLRRGHMYPYSWFTLLCIRNYWKAIYTPIKKRIICLNNLASLSQPVICGQSVMTHHDRSSSSIKIKPYICIV